MKDERKDPIEVYTDGACLNNPGPGGWGVYAVIDGKGHSWSGTDPQTTNQRMELMAAIKALELLPEDRSLAIYTDSQYVQKGMTDWIENWKRNGWRSGSKKPVANRDLWETLDANARGRNVNWIWVRGHAGNRGNERADALAQHAAGTAKIHIGEIG